MTATDRGLVPLVGLAVAAAALVLGAALPLAVDDRIQLVIAVFVATVVLWMTKPVPYAVSSLLCVILLYGFGLADTFSDAVSGFASTLVFFFILLLLFGLSISKVDLDEWVANRVVSTTSTPRSSIVRLAAAILLIAFVMPSALARTVTFLPVVDRINDLYELADDSAFRRLGYYLVGHLNPMASLAVMTGGATPILTAELITALVRPITWIEWAIYMAVPVALTFGIAALFAGYRYRVGDAVTIDRVSHAPAREAALDGTIEPLSRDQRIVILLLAFAIGAWIAGSFVGLPAVVPAMAVVFVLALPGVRIITANDLSEINWGIIFLLGAMLSLLDAMAAANAFGFVTDVALSGLDVHELGWVMLVVLLAFSIGIRATFSSPAPAIAILLPIVLEFTALLGLDGLFISFSLMLVLNIAVFLPVHGPTVLLAYESGPLTLAEVFLLGTMTVLLTLGVVTFSWLVYWPFVDGVLAGIFST